MKYVFSILFTLAAFLTFNSLSAQNTLQKEKKADESKEQYKTRMRKSYLYLGGGNVTNDSVHEIFQYPSLATLVVKSTNVDAAGVNIIAGHPNISFLSLERSKITDSSINAVSRMPSLIMLDVSYTPVSDQALNILKNKNLSYLNLSGTKISARSTQLIAENFKSLKRLDMMNTNLNDDSVAGLIGRKDTGEFNQELQKEEIEDEFYGKPKKKHSIPNQGLQKLIDLNLAGTEITDKGLAILTLMRGLQLLDISATNITSDGFKYLPRLNNIEVLSVSGTSFSDSEAEILLNLKKLKVLSLENTAVSDSTLRKLSKHPSIYSIYLNDSLVTQNGINKFLEKKPLCKLHHSTLNVSVKKESK